MNVEVKDFVTEKVNVLIHAATCCAEADIMPIDGLIAFAGSEAGAQVFGKEKAKNVLAHAEELKTAGAKYCDCPACAACEAILEKKGELL